MLFQLSLDATDLVSSQACLNETPLSPIRIRSQPREAPWAPLCRRISATCASAVTSPRWRGVTNAVLRFLAFS